MCAGDELNPYPQTLVCNYWVRGGQHQEQCSSPTPCNAISLLLRFPFKTPARALCAAPRRSRSPPAGQQPPHRLPTPRRLFPRSYPRPAPCQPPLLLLFRRVYPEVRQRGGVGSPSSSREIEFFKALPTSPPSRDGPWRRAKARHRREAPHSATPTAAAREGSEEKAAARLERGGGDGPEALLAFGGLGGACSSA